MKRLLIAFAVCFVVIGIPFWRIPYNQVDFSHLELVPGYGLLAILTGWLVVEAR